MLDVAVSSSPSRRRSSHARLRRRRLRYDSFRNLARRLLTDGAAGFFGSV
jgi:hypothetical protein